MECCQVYIEMVELWTKFSTLLLSDLYLFISFIIFNPLYFSYLLFFFPYLFKLVSFLSPLFFTICLVAVTAHSFRLQEFLTENSKVSLLIACADAIAVKLNSCEDRLSDKILTFEDFGVFEFLFGSTVMEIENYSGFSGVLEEKSCAVSEEISVCKNESFQDKMEKKKTSSLRSIKSGEDPENAPPVGSNHRNNNIRASILMKSDSDFVKKMVKGESCNAFERRDKEWKRTLGCKLLEDRRGCGAADGMDSLWEVYELERNVPAVKERNEMVKAMVEEEDDGGAVEVCCLQALKLSAGKMSLGIGRWKLAKMTKAIKGYRWLHSKHVNKKVHDNCDSY